MPPDSQRFEAASQLRVMIAAIRQQDIGESRFALLQSFGNMLDFICSQCVVSAEIGVRWRIFLQHLAADEGVLQLCRPASLNIIRILSLETTALLTPAYEQHATSLSRHCPALGLLLLAYHDEDYSETGVGLSALPDLSLLRAFLRSLIGIVEYQVRVLQPSTSAQTPTLAQPIFNAETLVPFEQSGTFYGSAKLRNRKLYMGMGEKAREDISDETQQARDSNEEAQCRKFFTQYVQAKRTGGIMALWCPHLICVRFHAIPKAEGRNDVFSAIFCHWATPPRVIVYDFACQLAPYCLSREPDFFKDTLFVVDQMHQHGHVKCGAASFLSTYMGTDTSLRNLNSSAAESGNAGLVRIKKSVSYCSQEHAVALIQHFLTIWNRRRILSSDYLQQQQQPDDDMIPSSIVE
ncbi:hypothetical protein OC846_006622 [Tilletia horrida]|uniref:Uncharacterized protein n=1 Tax=Tilletia horrida TaxID=155126 RepID=A0AAN6GIE1_9BASI|nr:hypothetical protein OC845_006635 [Tilletia horrida]KAK0542827.1 hypothetical protein OC846_006622 [Tilletia horrida]KAK0559212.1 hypothetical protein OC861_006716 [Tilletia horrida]